MNRFIGLALAVAIVLPGCISEDDFVAPTFSPVPIGLPSEKDPRIPAEATSPRVVVAVVDTGINFYHEWFQREDSLSDDVLGQFLDEQGRPPLRVPLTREGNWTRRVEADGNPLRALEPERLYYFEGTNVLGISFDPKPQRDDEFLFLTGASHGSATSGAVVENNPNTILLMAQNTTSRAENWVASRPWVDVVSMSYGPPGSVPGSGAAFQLNTHVNTKLMWQNGKVPVGAADNTPAFAPNDETAGPPWTIGVAGDNSTTGCREHVSGSVPDFTSDFRQRLPRHNDTRNLTNVSGTSFATPKTAGVFSRVIYETRVAWEHGRGIDAGALAQGPDGQQLTFASLRAAFNRTARYFDSSACPTSPGTSLPVNPAAPWAQQGWGHVGPEIAQATVDHVLGTNEAPPKPEAARTFQEAMYRYRETLWNQI